MSLIQLGDFLLSSGIRSRLKIDCNALTEQDWQAIATIMSDVLDPFSVVEGVPSGGLELAKAFNKFINPNANKLLIVDDVLTTGASMEKQRSGREAMGFVLFARGPCSDWIDCWFSCHPILYATSPFMRYI